MGHRVDLSELRSLGSPGEPQLGVSSLEQSMRLVQGVGAKKKKKKIPVNWKQLLLLGPSAAARGRSVATVKIRNEQK